MTHPRRAVGRYLVPGIFLLAPYWLAAQDLSKRKCEPAMSKKDVPPVRTFLDSASAILGLQGLALAGGRGLLSLRFARGATQPLISWIDPATGPDTIPNVLADAVLPRPVLDPWAIRLEVRPGPDAAITAVAPLFCPPVPSETNSTAPMAFRVELRSGDRPPSPRRSIRVVAELEISETGQVGERKMIRPSGIFELDQGVLEHVRGWSFAPALLEGMPVRSLYRTDGSGVRP